MNQPITHSDRSASAASPTNRSTLLVGRLLGRRSAQTASQLLTLMAELSKT